MYQIVVRDDFVVNYKIGNVSEENCFLDKVLMELKIIV